MPTPKKPIRPQNRSIMDRLKEFGAWVSNERAATTQSHKPDPVQSKRLPKGMNQNTKKLMNQVEGFKPPPPRKP